MKCKRSITDNVMIACVLAASMACLAACQQQLSEHGRVKPLQEDGFFADGGSARPPVPGTVSRDNVNDGSVYYTGREAGGGYARRSPVPVDEGLLRAGGEEFAVYCSVCHGPRGEGDGMVVRRGFTKPPSYQSPALRAAPPGYLFSVMTEGFKTMAAYGDLVDEKGRWAIAAYIKGSLQGERGG